MKKRGEYYITQFFYLNLQTLIFIRKDETIKILDGCLDIVDGHFVYFVSEFR